MTIYVHTSSLTCLKLYLIIQHFSYHLLTSVLVDVAPLIMVATDTIVVRGF